MPIHVLRLKQSVFSKIHLERYVLSLIMRKVAYRLFARTPNNSKVKKLRVEINKAQYWQGRVCICKSGLNILLAQYILDPMQIYVTRYCQFLRNIHTPLPKTQPYFILFLLGFKTLDLSFTGSQGSIYQRVFYGILISIKGRKVFCSQVSFGETRLNEVNQAYVLWDLQSLQILIPNNLQNMKKPSKTLATHFFWSMPMWENYFTNMFWESVV